MVEHAKIPNLDGLKELAARDGANIKPTLLRVMSDLYVQKPAHTPEEEAHFTGLALRLIGQVDAATQTIVAERLAGYPGTPPILIERLRHCLSGNKAAAPEEPSHAPSPAPAAAGAAAQPATLTELSELFLTADGQERRMILLHLDFTDLPPADPISPYTAQEAIRRLEMAALTHNSESFAQEIERTLRIDRELARRLIEDQSGEPILVVAQALGMPTDVLQRILLCLNPAISHSVLRVYELSMLYDELEPQSVSRLIAIWQAIHPPSQRPATRPAHQPQLYDDRKGQGALPARPAVRWEEHSQHRVGEN